MEIIRPFSIEGPEQEKFEQGVRKMIDEFLEELPRIETSELAKDSQCVICQCEYGLGNSDVDTIEDVEEAVRLPCGHLGGRKCILKWLKLGNSCPMCRKKVYLVAPWPHIIPDENYWDELKYFVPSFDDICRTLFRSDYTLENMGSGLRGRSPPGWIVRPPGCDNEDDKSLLGFFHDRGNRRKFARKILSTPPPEVEKAAWMLQTYPEPGELQAHVEALASAFETANPRGVLYIQLRDDGGATIYQVHTYTHSDKPCQDEGVFRTLVLRRALNGGPLNWGEGCQGSWWAYVGDGDDFSTGDLHFWEEIRGQNSDFDSNRRIDDPDRDGGIGAEAVAAFGR
ncbi:MAG: hypothetical protein ASARMPRED_001468 [Alectoria sarmentosa]|nr:MAG: hypothetical protein ASARMPRED_001468 [Alectoria sarmentosa]